MNAINYLNVFYGNSTVGRIFNTSPISFEYDHEWLSDSAAFPIVNLPLQTDRINSDAVTAFFENLLPEGNLRDYIISQRHATTLFSLLDAIAGDTAGALVILRPGQMPAPYHYTKTSWQALANLLNNKPAIALNIDKADTRISLAGAQDKTSIAIFADGSPQLPIGSAPSTHILKPNINRFAKVWHSAVNETIVMQTSANCELPTANVFYEPHTQSCIVKRFDRHTKSDGSLHRIMQYDFCQLAGINSSLKYQQEGGPNITLCANIIRRFSSQPAVDLQLMVSWIFFNLYTGNNDSHAKNLSLYIQPNGGMRLTPFYDLMCTRVYPGLAKNFAFSIGGEYSPGKITKQHITNMAKQLGMRPQFLLDLAEDLANKIPQAMAASIETTKPVLPESAVVLAERLHNFICGTTRKTINRIKQANAY